MPYSHIPLDNDTADHRFVFTVDGYHAFIDYRKSEDVVYLLHTEVANELEGKGVASAMVEKTFQYLEQHNLKAIPRCPYIKAYLKRHPEWERVIANY